MTPPYSFDRPLSVGIPPMTSHPAFRDALTGSQITQVNLAYPPANQTSSNPYTSANQNVSATTWPANQSSNLLAPMTLLRPDQYARQPLPSGGFYLEPTTLDVSTQARSQTTHSGVWPSYSPSLSVA